MEIDKELVKKFLNTPGARQALREGDYDKLFELCGSQKKRSNLAAALYSSNIDFLSKMKEIPDSLFRGCDLFDSIDIPGNIKKIGEYAFFNCSNLKHINISDGVEEVGDAAFAQTGIKEITIPKSIKKLGQICFGKAVVTCDFSKEEFKDIIAKENSWETNDVTVRMVKNTQGEVIWKNGETN